MIERVLDFIRRFYNKIDSFVENSVCNKTRYSIFWIIAVLACFSVLLFLNILTPFISDDFAYFFIYGEQARVASIGDVIQSQVNHYYQWGGRSVVHFIAQVLLMLPSYIADILNTLVYLAYAYLIYLHIKGRGCDSISLFILINLAVWFLQPVIGDTILWITGSANYLWGTTLILVFLLPYRFYNGINRSRLREIIVFLGLFVFGIIAGWTNENTAGAMILIAVFFIFHYRSQGWKIPVWSISGLVGGIIGFAFMILAPGNLERAGEASGLSLYILAYRLFNSTLTFFYYNGAAILLSVLLLVLYRWFPKREQDALVKVSLIYTIAAVAAVYAMLLSPTFPRRALFGVVTYLIIGMGVLFYNLDFKHKFLRQIRLSVIVVGLVCFLFTFYIATKEISIYRHMVETREVAIEEAKTQGVDSCEFERYNGGIYIHGEDPFSEKLMTRYYGIDIKLRTPEN
ncbi:MAG: DUF6056 family protein [Dysgonomonas sp.]